nr:immunoglobulin light chain junction region [Macaca mulatta]MOX29261.1 immunoglobulin light chain junction region [Macaca mulatta]MOX29279.1 immunoglobulin light chain junction region [Macaca mulatta]MOX29560.1 immunoglobulin light chain junction region [Macaca mulatta]MOX29579.1 immunoglobulin light chain junction region [Macaca mulatta]
DYYCQSYDSTGSMLF